MFVFLFCGDKLVSGICLLFILGLFVINIIEVLFFFVLLLIVKEKLNLIGFNNVLMVDLI